MKPALSEANTANSTLTLDYQDMKAKRNTGFKTKLTHSTGTVALECPDDPGVDSQT
jgi:hypothetical protein